MNKFPSFRVFLSVLSLAFYAAFNYLWTVNRAPLTGAANAQQMTDTLVGYNIHNTVARGDVDNIGLISLIVLFCVIWFPYFWRMFRSDNECSSDCCNH